MLLVCEGTGPGGQCVGGLDNGHGGGRYGTEWCGSHVTDHGTGGGK